MPLVVELRVGELLAKMVKKRTAGSWASWGVKGGENSGKELCKSLDQRLFGREVVVEGGDVDTGAFRHGAGAQAFEARRCNDVESGLEEAFAAVDLLDYSGNEGFGSVRGRDHGLLYHQCDYIIK